MKKHPATQRSSLAASFRFAFLGLWAALRSERNLKIHLAAATAALILAGWLELSPLRTVAVLLAIGLVMVAELLNAAIEATVDLCVGSKQSEAARLAKDISAGAVLLAALVAAAVGAILYLPPLWRHLRSLLEN